MQVHIEEISSSIHAVDSESLLSPAVMRQIVNTVTRAVADEREHERRVESEQRVNAGRTQNRPGDWED